MRRRVLPVIGLLAGSGATAAAAVRRARAEIAASATEQAASLPGDEVLPEASMRRTYAVSIAAAPAAVWLWIAQLGQERGGFYTYTALENLAGCRITNADAIVPEWQDVRLGDSVRLHPDMALLIARVEPGHALVARTPTIGPDGKPMDFQFSWAFVVEAEGAGTRLLVRERYEPRNAAGRRLVLACTPIAVVMTYGMLRGIRDRAEARTTHAQ